MVKEAIQLCLVFLLLTHSFAQSKNTKGLPPKSVKLEWTVRQKTDGKLASGYHIYTLTCVNGRCTLYGVTLNQCDEEQQAAFYPAVEYWDNIPEEQDRSSLEVRFPREGVVELSLHSWDFGITDTKMHLEYLKNDGSKLQATVTKFSGAVVKNSEILGKILSWDLEPITYHSGLTRVPLSCSFIVVPAVATPN